MTEEDDGIMEIGGICIKCNLEFPAIQKSYMTKEGQICAVCNDHKGDWYPQHCNKCGLDWFSIMKGEQKFCVNCMVKGFGYLMKFQKENK